MNKKITKKDIETIINQHPKVCYRDLEKIILDMYPQLNYGDRVYDKPLCTARPLCGYDCDDVCPVSGKASN